LGVRLPALLAVFAILLATTAAAAPLLHGGDLDHCCEFCHIGHVPILKPAGGIVFHAPVALVSSVIVASQLCVEHCSFGTPSSRAPPA
jgi:hypothetical protein